MTPCRRNLVGTERHRTSMELLKTGTDQRLASWVTMVAFALTTLSSTGCYRTQNVVTMNALDTKVPVSASGQYIDAQGQVVTEDDYEVVSQFNFEKTVESPRHQKSAQELELEAEIDRIVSQAGGQAVTNFRLEGTEYSSGSHGAAATWKALGWSSTLTGLTFIAIGAAVGDPDLYPVFFPIGGIFTGVGLLSFGGALAARKPASWHFSVGGNVVTRGGGAARSVTTVAPTEPAVEEREELPEGVTERTRPAPARKDDAIEPLPR
jgi:hypothetical protein